MSFSQQDGPAIVRKPFFLMRHAPTADNVRGVASGGRRDPDITEEGRLAMNARHEIYALLDRKPTDIIVTSLKRTRQTAEAFLADDCAHVRFVVEPDLNERDLGKFDGRISYDRIKRLKSRHIGLPEEESEAEHTRRMLRGLNARLESSVSHPLIVTHAGTIRRIFDAMGVGGNIHVENGQIFECVPVGDNGWKIFELAVDMGKLARHELTAANITRETFRNTGIGPGL